MLYNRQKYQYYLAGGIPVLSNLRACSIKKTNIYIYTVYIYTQITPIWWFIRWFLATKWVLSFTRLSILERPGAACGCRQCRPTQLTTSVARSKIHGSSQLPQSPAYNSQNCQLTTSIARYNFHCQVLIGAICFYKVPKYEFGHRTDRHGRHRRKTAGKFDVCATRIQLETSRTRIRPNIRGPNLFSCLQEKTRDWIRLGFLLNPARNFRSCARPRISGHWTRPWNFHLSRPRISIGSGPPARICVDKWNCTLKWHVMLFSLGFQLDTIRPGFSIGCGSDLCRRVAWNCVFN